MFIVMWYHTMCECVDGRAVKTGGWRDQQLVRCRQVQSVWAGQCLGRHCRQWRRSTCSTDGLTRTRNQRPATGTRPLTDSHRREPTTMSLSYEPV